MKGKKKKNLQNAFVCNQNIQKKMKKKYESVSD